MDAIERLASRLKPLGYEVSLGREDGIPYLVIWTDKLVSFTVAPHLARGVQDAFGCPVHFHRLEGSSMSFFVFQPTRQYSVRQFEEYGTPLELWLKVVDPNPVPYKMPIPEASPATMDLFGDEGSPQASLRP